jgi:malate dehydrogenase (oxaloacetate-decarboxylating)
VVLAAVLNALKLRGTPIESAQVTINGAGAAGIAVAKLLMGAGVGDVIICDRCGAIYTGRAEGMNAAKDELAAQTNRERVSGDLKDALRGSDVFVGLSAANIMSSDHIGVMNPKPIVLALANPNPEILPHLAHLAGALVVATGRSDFPNQVNNSLAFPGVFRGALDAKASDINDEMKVAAAHAIANLVTEAELRADHIIPDALDLRVAPAVAVAVAQAAVDSGVARAPVDPIEIERRTEDLIYSNHPADWAVAR